MSASLVAYYDAIEQASVDMLTAARGGDWNRVMKFERVYTVLISRLKRQALHKQIGPDEKTRKAHLMQRILINDGEVRRLANPWLDGLDDLLACKVKTLH